MWFAGDKTTPFLVHVRALAPERLGLLVEPGDTRAIDHAGCLLMVQLPGVPDGGWIGTTNNLQVAWEDGVLGGYWGGRDLWDDFDERDDEALVARGLVLTDDQAADVAVAWLAAQLSRPLDHLVWAERGRVVAQRWVLADTGRELGRRGSKRARRRAPTSVTRLRPRG